MERGGRQAGVRPMIRKIISIRKENTLDLKLIIAAEFSIDESGARKMVLQGGVFREKKRLKNPEAVLSGGEVEAFFPHKPIEEYTFAPELIRFEDEHILLVFKEPGVPSCPSPFSDTNCLTWGVEKYLHSKGNHYTVHAVHRLDQPAQGLIFFAKHKEAEKALHKMFLERKVKKVYCAVTQEMIDPPLRLVIKDVVDWRGKVQEARSFIKYLGSRDGMSFFAASPLTGRPHQIRKHFAKYLSPIIGDAQYGGYSSEDELLLCACRYRFRHPLTGEWMDITHVPEKFGPSLTKPTL